MKGSKPTCVICRKKIGKIAIPMPALNGLLHPECFTCSVCDVKLEGESYRMRKERFYCEPCLWQQMSLKCKRYVFPGSTGHCVIAFVSRCGNDIASQGTPAYVSVDGHHFHKKCFNCYACQTVRLIHSQFRMYDQQLNDSIFPNQKPVPLAIFQATEGCL